MLTILFAAVVAIAVIWALAYHAASAAVWSVVIGAGLLVLTGSGALNGAFAGLLWVAFIVLAVISNLKSLRQSLVTTPIFKIYKKLLPQMSQTEREALEAGTVWWDGDLFSGKPDWNKLLDYPAPKITAEEQAFIDGPTEQLCAMVNEWEISHELRDLPPTLPRTPFATRLNPMASRASVESISMQVLPESKVAYRSH